MSDISKNIKNLRLSKEMSQAQLAERLNVTRQTVSNWERGASYPDIPMLEELAKVFGVEIGEVIYPQGKKNSLLKQNEPLPMGFVPVSAFLYMILLIFLRGDPVWALVLLVSYIGLCTCLIIQWISTAFSEPTPSRFDEMLKKYSQNQE